MDVMDEATFSRHLAMLMCTDNATFPVADCVIMFYYAAIL